MNACSDSDLHSNERGLEYDQSADTDRMAVIGQAASTPKTLNPAKASFGAGSLPNPAVLVLDPSVTVPEPMGIG